MKAYKFNTKISSEGVIKIPFTPYLFDKDVEIIIVPKTEKKRPDKAGKKFVEKWAGFLESKDIDTSKYNYLSNKYQ